MTDGAAPSMRRAGSGPPVVLVHGFLGGSAQWAAEIDALSAHFDVIAVDLPGFGDAKARPGLQTIPDLADAVLEKLDAVGVGRFALLGHSMGGMIVQEIARRAPDRLHRLVLYGTGPDGEMPGRFETIATSKARLAEDGVAPTAARIAATWLRHGTNAAAYPLLRDIGASASADAAQNALSAMAIWSGRDALSGFTMPTMILWGDQDRSYRWPQIHDLWTAIPNAQLAVVPGASHAAHAEKPAIVCAVLADFFSADLSG
ncbi:MAG: alpha/beta fold hydrolase [Pseudomonadota bacterium]